MNQTGNEETLQWQWKGDLTIPRVAGLKQELQQALATVDRLQIDLSAAAEVDAACLQLLCSAHRTATTMNKQLALTGLQRHAATLRAAGFARHIGCALDCSGSCIWVDWTEKKEA